MIRKNLTIASVLLVLISTLTFTGCVGPRLEVLSEKLDETSVKTDGEDDLAVTYTVRVRNKGTAGKVRLMAQLHHPEGTFYSEELLSFRQGEDKVVQFVFREPSVVGSFIQGMNKNTEMKAVFRYESVQ
jgi:hypothetical protein